MDFKVITAAEDEPVSLEEARLHLRRGDDETSEDSKIQTLIGTAREVAEHYCQRSLVAQTLEMPLNCFPHWREPILLAHPPVTSIVSIKYTDTMGVEQTLDPAFYVLSTYGESREVSLAYGHWWPITQSIRNAVRVQYLTGYTVDTVPRAAKSAILLILAHLFENPQEVVVDTRAAAIQIPMGAERLLDTIKVYG